MTIVMFEVAVQDDTAYLARTLVILLAIVIMKTDLSQKSSRYLISNIFLEPPQNITLLLDHGIFLNGYRSYLSSLAADP